MGGGYLLACGQLTISYPDEEMTPAPNNHKLLIQLFRDGRGLFSPSLTFDRIVRALVYAGFDSSCSNERSSHITSKRQRSPALLCALSLGMAGRGLIWGSALTLTPSTLTACESRCSLLPKQ